MFKKIHVYDLDGVLVDSSHRYRNNPDGTIDLEYWLANRVPEKIAKDKLLPMARKYFADNFDSRVYTIIATSRMYHVNDLAFIVGHLGKPNKLFMRPEGNMEPDGVLKRKQLIGLLNLKQFRHLPRFFWDDNIKNLAAVSDLFTRVFHVSSQQGYK